MTFVRGEFTCKACGHSFNRPVSGADSQLRCPRCGGEKLEENPFLLGTGDASELTAEDYFDVALAPCCTPNWRGWRQHLYSTAFCQGPSPPQEDRPEPEKP